MSNLNQALINDVAKVLHSQDLSLLPVFALAAAFTYDQLPEHVQAVYERRAVEIILPVADRVATWRK